MLCPFCLSLSLCKTPSEWKQRESYWGGERQVEVKRWKWEGSLKTRNRRKKKTNKTIQAWACLEHFSSRSPYQCLDCTFLQIIPQCREGFETPRSGIHLHSYWFFSFPALSLFFPFKRQSKMEFQGAKKKQSRTHSSNKNPWENVPQGSIWLPCGCNVFVRPSPLITIMSQEGRVRVCSCGFAKMCKSVFAKV